MLSSLRSVYPKSTRSVCETIFRGYICGVEPAVFSSFTCSSTKTPAKIKPVCSFPSKRLLSKDAVEGKNLFQDRILTVPNTLCLVRIGLTPLIGYLVISHCFVSACSLFVVAGVTDLLDGYIARHVVGQSSLLGSILDPLADKFLVTTMFLTLTYVNLIPPFLTVLVISRDVCLIAGGVIARLRLLTPPRTLKRFFNPSISPTRVSPTFISKVNTALQLIVVAASLGASVYDFSSLHWLSLLYVTTGITTVFSGLQYAFLNRMKRV